MSGYYRIEAVAEHDGRLVSAARFFTMLQYELAPYDLLRANVDHIRFDLWREGCNIDDMEWTGAYVPGRGIE